MALIAVSRKEIERLLTHANGLYEVLSVWQYNTVFTHTIDVLPIAEPDVVMAEIGQRFQGLADIISSEWVDNGEIEHAFIRIWISEHASPGVS